MSAPIPWKLFSRKLLALYVPPLRQPATYDTVRRILKNLSRVPDVQSSGDLIPEVIAQYVVNRSKEVNANTLIGELGYLKSICTWAVDEEYLGKTPFRGVRRRPTGWIRPCAPKPNQYHPLAEIGRVLDRQSRRVGTWDGHRLYALASLAAYTGVRRNEALYAQVQDVDLDMRILRVMGRTRLKTLASAAPVPLCTELVEVLREWIPRTGSIWLFPGAENRGPWYTGGKGGKPLHRLKELGKEVGVKGLTFQSLRHSWATHAESAWGLSGPVIQRVLRHTTEETSRRHYRHADLVNLANAVRDLSYPAPAPKKPPVARREGRELGPAAPGNELRQTA